MERAGRCGSQLIYLLHIAWRQIMTELKRVQRIDSTPFQSPTEQNVQGWERIGSLAGGVIMVGKGLRRGGVFGLIQVAIGGVAMARGITGHSSVKSLLEKAVRT
jgi:uncharacterized membrane protein